jgi:hypothetical protein
MNSSLFNKSSVKESPTVELTEFELNPIITELKIWVKIIKLNFFKIIAGGLVGSIIGFTLAIKDKPMYSAVTRFMIKNEGVGSLFGGQMTGLTSLLGGGQMGSPLERTAEVISSDKIIAKAIINNVIVRDSIDLLINHLIRLSNITQSEMINDSIFNANQFMNFNGDISSLNISQRKTYKIIKKLLTPDIGEGVIRKSFDKKSGILTLNCVHQDEDLAILLSNSLFNELNNFFIEQMTYTSSYNVNVMRKKLDSIQYELNKVRKDFAISTDQSLGLLLNQDKVKLKDLATKEQILNLMYSEALKNYQTFQFVNETAIPTLTLIDKPYSPITKIEKNKYKYLFYSFVLFSLFSIFLYRFLILIKKGH